MRLIITESKIVNLIRKYLYKDYMPDAFFLFDIETPEARREFFEGEVEKYGLYDFDINTWTLCTYYGEWDAYDYMYHLKMGDKAERQLNSLFGDVWVPVFKDWFEEITGLEVREMVVNDELVRFD
jgi:hypothetical protein